MGAIIFLVLFPIVIAFAFLAVKGERMREVMVYASAAVILAASVVVAVRFFPSKGEFFSVYGDSVKYVMLGLEVLLALYMTYIGIRHRNYLAAPLAIAQTAIIIWFEFSRGSHIEIQHNLQMDKISVVMILITSIVASACCIYALGYVRKTEAEDSAETGGYRSMFFSMFLATGAMIGLFSSNNTTWMYFFWQLITVSSFWLVAHTGTEESVKRAFRGLNMNLLGGLMFVIGIFILGIVFGTVEFSTMLIYGRIYGNLVLIPATFIAFAGIVRSGLMPFNSWITEAVKSSAPAAALLTSVVVNSGVSLILRLASLFGTASFPGIMIMTIGGVSFLFAALASIPKQDVRVVLGYSTVSVMGLAVACAGLGKAEALWAGIMLVVFHSLLKPALVMCFGTAGRITGHSMKELEGMIVKMPRLGLLTVTAVTGMFLVPFGIVICIWGALSAFTDAGFLTIMGVLCFGLAAADMCWIKLMGNVSAVIEGEESSDKGIDRREMIIQAFLVIFSVLMCIALPLVSTYGLVPYIKSVFGGSVTGIISSSNIVIVVIMMTLLILAWIFLYGRSRGKPASVYLAGVNSGDDMTYCGAMQEQVRYSLGATPVDRFFSEGRMLLVGGTVSAALLVAGIGAVVGNFISLIGGGVQ